MPHRRQSSSDLCAIFVHAGAGYHSIANERHHLGAANDAARIGMAILKNGGDATDAVEMAIRLLEDREITNAGYGSNLTIEGQVECDATMVDHLGRSGAVGAVTQVKNPIAVARVVLEASSTPLSLQRVPPNLLVGPGAVDFAEAHGISILPNEYLISETARTRWLSWKQDLIQANGGEQNTSIGNAEVKKMLQTEREHIQRPTVNTAGLPPSPIDEFNNDCSQTPPPYAPDRACQGSSEGQPMFSRRPETLRDSAAPQSDDAHPYHKYARVSGWTRFRPNTTTTNAESADQVVSTSKRQRLDGAEDTLSLNADPPLLSALGHSGRPVDDVAKEDQITDTVGCIAIDCFGRIAAGSSSGGIGMKHKGRCGPAALVGIGTAVIPTDPNDPEQTCVATVTSGTGEHMATTAAAATAASRVYHRVRRDGTEFTPCDEDEALSAMLKTDFMQHPGVQDQPCVGAIGILAVRKTREGIYLYFAHNTDSFAIASMTSEERKPVCTMSRSKGNGSIAQGGRGTRFRAAKT